MKEKENQKIPVLVEVDSALLRASGEDIAPEDELPRLADAIGNGLHATLKTGSLLTGQMYVDFDYYPEEETKDLTYQGDFPVVPTLASGFAQIEVKLASILEKIDALPIDDTVAQITNAARETATTVSEAKLALKQIEEAAAAARETMDNPELRNSPRI